MKVKIDTMAGIDGVMAPSFHPKTFRHGVARAFSTTLDSEIGSDLRRSGLVNIECIDPYEFQLVGQPLWPKNQDKVQVAYEDPTIIEIEGELYVTFTDARKPISRLDCSSLFPDSRQSWHLAMPMIMPYSRRAWQTDKIQPMIEVGRFRSEIAPYNTIKEIEILPGTDIIFCEVGSGPELPSSVYWGRINNSLQITELNPFIVPDKDSRWMSEHCSTGPIVRITKRYWKMYLNGQKSIPPPTRGVRAVWSIGEAIIRLNSKGLPELISIRGPIITPKIENNFNFQAICFAASYIEQYKTLYWHDDWNMHAFSDLD